MDYDDYKGYQVSRGLPKFVKLLLAPSHEALRKAIIDDLATDPLSWRMLFRGREPRGALQMVSIQGDICSLVMRMDQISHGPGP